MNFNMQGHFIHEIQTVEDAKLKGELDAAAGRPPITINNSKLQTAYDNIYGKTMGVKDAKYTGQFSVILEIFNRPTLFKSYYDAFADKIGEADALNASPPRDFRAQPRLQEIYNQKYKNTAKKLGVSDDITGPARKYSWNEAQMCYDEGRKNNIKLIARYDAQQGAKPNFSNISDPALEKIYMNEYKNACLNIHKKSSSYPK